jgi:predicted O-methyltransferase YrrM
MMRPDRAALAEQTIGWLHPDEGEALHAWAMSCDGPFVELGSFAGKSTTYIGDAAEQRCTILFAVDWHRGSPEMAPDRECHIPAAVDPSTGRHDTLRLLRATLEAADLEDIVIPVAGTSQTVGRWWGGEVGFVFIDACHDEPVMDDHILWAPRVRSGGILAFHDSEIPAIARAIDQAITDGFEPAGVCQSLTALRRP